MISIKVDKGTVSADFQMSSKNELIQDVANFAGNAYKNKEMITLLKMVMYLLMNIEKNLEETENEHIQVAAIEIDDVFLGLVEEFRERTMGSEVCACGKCH